MTTPLDQLPIGWTVVPISQVGLVKVGRQRSPKNQTGRFSTKYIRAGNITARGLDLTDVLEMDFPPSERAVFELLDGDVVLAEASGSSAQVGRCAIWRGEIPTCCYQNTVIRFRPHAAVPEYALIFFRHLWKRGVFAHTAKGVGIQHLGSSRFARLPFSLPPIAEQRRIAAAFQTREEAIRGSEASLRSALEHSQQQEREILGAGATGELVDGNGDGITAGPLERESLRGAPSLFDGIEAQGLYEIPAEWRWIRVDAAGEVSLGKGLSPSARTGRGLRQYLRVANVLEDRIDFSDLKKMSFSKKEFEHYVLKPGDILLNEGQSPELAGRPAIYRGEVEGVGFQNHLIRFRPTPAVTSEFALVVFRHYLHSGEFLKIARWTTNIANLGLQRFAAMPFPLPPLKVQRAIAKEVRARLRRLHTQREAIETSLNRIAELEEELLSAAVSGRLVASDVNDESASAMLERLGPPIEPRREETRPLHDEETVMSRERRQADEGTVKSLASAISEAGRPLSVPELFAACGYDRDSTADVERFYLELRNAIGRHIRQVDDSTENALIDLVRR